MQLAFGVIPQGYALYLGADTVFIGRLAAVQALAGMATLAGAFLVERRNERRVWCGVLSGIGRMIWFLTALSALFLSPSPALAVLLIITTLSLTLVNLGVPAWMSWMNDLVPAGVRGRFFARRSVYLTLVSVLAAPLVGRALDLGKVHIGERYTYALLFALAGVFGLANLFLLLAQPEPAYTKPEKTPRLTLEYFLGPLRNVAFRRFLFAVTGWAFAQSVAGPFFAVFQLKTLGFSFFAVQAVGAIAALTTLAFTPAVGYLADKYGNKALYIIAYIVVTIIPLFWALMRPDLPVLTWTLLIVAQSLSGIIGAMMGITQFNLMLGLSPSGETARYSALFTATTGLAGFLGPQVGGLLAAATRNIVIPAGGWSLDSLKFTFIVSTVLRLAVIPLLLKVTEPEAEEVREVLSRLAGARPIAAFSHLRRIRKPERPEQRASSAAALGRMKERLALEELVEALNDPVVTVRRQAVISLGELRDARAVEPLIEALRPDAGVRTQAAVALGKIGDMRAVAPLIEAIEQDGGKDPAFVQAAAYALGRLGAPEAAMPLLQIAEEPAHPARAAAIQGLGELGEESAAGPLTEMLISDRELEPQEVGALGDALAKLGEAGAVVPLLERVESADTPLLRRELVHDAARLLGRGDTLYAWLSQDDYARESALDAMLTAHAKSLKKPSASVRLEAAMAALTENDLRSVVRHVHLAARKAGLLKPGPATDALVWVAGRAKERGVSEEEALIALAAFDALAGG
jgi:HEAT repeat protein